VVKPAAPAVRRWWSETAAASKGMADRHLLDPLRGVVADLFNRTPRLAGGTRQRRQIETTLSASKEDVHVDFDRALCCQHAAPSCL
jgi:hypothetical protein